MRPFNSSVSTRLGVFLALFGTACAGANTAELREGSSGLSGAIPGGDGRSLAGYKAEFTANAMQGMDSLMIRTNQVWQDDDEEVLLGLFAPGVSYVAPDGNLLSNAEGVRAFVESELDRTTGHEIWRDDFAASGLMTYIYGRYKVLGAQAGTADDHEGVQLTVAVRDRFTWKIRSKMYVPFEGAPPATPREVAQDPPPHLTPDDIRATFGRRAVRGQNERAEWAVNSYFYMNSFLGRVRYAWNNDDFDTLVSLMDTKVVSRFPYDIPAVGRVNTGYSLERLLPAVGEMHMDILDFEASERLAFAMGSYSLEGMGSQIDGYFSAVVQTTDDGPVLRALLFSGAGAREVATLGEGPGPS